MRKFSGIRKLVDERGGGRGRRGGRGGRGRRAVLSHAEPRLLLLRVDGRDPAAHILLAGGLLYFAPSPRGANGADGAALSDPDFAGSVEKLQNGITKYSGSPTARYEIEAVRAYHFFLFHARLNY